MSGENGSVPVVDTGLGGGTMFDFVWESDDPLSKNISPMKYGRVDIDYEGEGLAEGLIVDVIKARSAETGEDVDGTWILRISVGPPHAWPVARAIKDKKNLNVRVRA